MRTAPRRTRRRAPSRALRARARRPSSRTRPHTRPLRVSAPRSSPTDPVRRFAVS
jgi:hypothetical protein